MASFAGLTIPDITINEVFYVIIFLLFCIIAAIIIRKKVSGKKRSDIYKYLFDVKLFMEKDDVEKEDKTKRYDKLILTEFPNFLKFRKKLINEKVVDDGKDN